MRSDLGTVFSAHGGGTIIVDVLIYISVRCFLITFPCEWVLPFHLRVLLECCSQMKTTESIALGLDFRSTL